MTSIVADKHALVSVLSCLEWTPCLREEGGEGVEYVSKNNKYAMSFSIRKESAILIGT